MNEYRPLGIGIDTAINLLTEVFGTPYIIPVTDETPADALYNASVTEAAKYDRMSQYGTPVIGTFWAVSGDLPYKIYNTEGKLIEKEFSDFEFPLATIVDFSRPKNIVKTNTIGSGGTVKEIFGFGDWKINIRGLLLDDSSRTGQKTAKEQRYMLERIHEIAGSIKLKGKIFEERYISRIAIEDFSTTPVQGKPGMLQYEMECSSDEDFLLTGV